MIFNLGSINADYFYRVKDFPKPGETLSAESFSKALGGKGANQSVAIAKAGSKVCHIGCIGDDGAWLRDAMTAFGVDMAHTKTDPDHLTGHAIITIDQAGENQIVLHAGANHQIKETQIGTALTCVGADDWLVAQNETNLVKFTAALMKEKGGKVAYSPAPFVADTCLQVLPFVDVVALNEGEALAMTDALGVSDVSRLNVPTVLVTKGGQGGTVFHQGTRIESPGIAVTAKDTTAAGDTFFGYFVSALAQGSNIQSAMDLANTAGALKVTRFGTADAIPTLSEVTSFRP